MPQLYSGTHYTADTDETAQIYYMKILRSKEKLINFNNIPKQQFEKQILCNLPILMFKQTLLKTVTSV